MAVIDTLQVNGVSYDFKDKKAYVKPATGIPASDIAEGVIPDVSPFITKSVDDLVNYYLKSETYTKAEVQALIGAINQFKYEVYASLEAITSPANNVLYLIGPTGSGSDKYEEYVWPDAQTGFVLIGTTSIDLSGYVTTTALNTALANYTTTANLTTLLAAKLDKTDVVNDLTTGGTAKALSAEQGKVLKGEVSQLGQIVFHQIPTFINGTIGGNGAYSEDSSKLLSALFYRKCKLTVKSGYKIQKYVEYSSPEISTSNFIQSHTVGDTSFEYSGEHYIVFVIYVPGSSSSLSPTADCVESFFQSGNLQDEISLLYAEKVAKDDIADNLTTNDPKKVLSAKQGKVLKDSVDEINGKLTKTVNLANSIEWTQGKFIRSSDGKIITTSAANKVGVIVIKPLYSKLVFDFSIKSGGSNNKYGWKITDAQDAILAHSDEYFYNDNPEDSKTISQIPSGARFLYISWNTNLETSPSCAADETIENVFQAVEEQGATVSELSASVESINTHIAEIDTEINGLLEFNIENAGVEAFMNVKYNNGDYSYTKLPYATAGGGGNPGYQLPNPVTIATPLHETAASRQIQIADNASFTDARVFSLDLVSTSAALYNLEPRKLYYYRVYYDNSSTNLISSGTIRTKGLVRDLKIMANSNYDNSFIKNVRDLGGWLTDDGKRIRYGILFRGNELNHDNDGTIVTYVGSAGINELSAAGVSAELDLRGGDYSESAIGSDVAYANIPVDLLFYRLNIYNTVTTKIEAFANAIRQLIIWMKAGKGVYMHCQGGCDRTGVLCAFIEGICGVSENDINHDYELSNRDRSREYYLISKGDNYDGDFKFAMEYIKGLLEYNGHIYVYYRGNYYDAQATVSSYTPVALTDVSLLAALGTLPFGTLKERFHRLMKLGGMTEREMEELEMLMCS